MKKLASDGTLSGLLANMDSFGIDISIIQPVVTKQSQTENVNLWVKSVSENSSGRIISFGSIYPHSHDYKSDIDFVAGLGLKGLKLHPEYQNFILDDSRMLKIYDYALSRGLFLCSTRGSTLPFRRPLKAALSSLPI
jgi:predicted TIM-barrel fold metal-dependent hydrolase